MKLNKFMLIIFYLVIVVFIGLWIIEENIFIKDKVSSRAKKVFLPTSISSDLNEAG
ncbi:MAG: hypothetical protein ACQERJ_01920 [Bacillota bacterium]